MGNINLAAIHPTVKTVGFLAERCVTTLVQLFEATNGGFRHRFACPATASTMNFIFKTSRADVVELKNSLG
jgi:hypothetical protein